MVLSYTGGVYLPARTSAAKPLTEPSPADVGEVYLPLGTEAACYQLQTDAENTVLQAGETVATLSDGTPIYATLSGTFDGVFDYRGMHYAHLVADKTAASLTENVRSVRQPETNKLSDLSADELLQTIRQLGIWDRHTGDWLWRRLPHAIGHTRRILLNTIDDGWNFSGYTATLQDAGDALNGAKILLHLLGATKILLLFDHARYRTGEALQPLINDPQLILSVDIDAKYPACEETLYEAVYAKQLPRGRTAQDEGVFFLRPQTAAALYRAMLTGKPQTTDLLTVAGDGFGQNGVVRLPLGTPWTRIAALGKFKGGAYELQTDSPLHGQPAEGVWGGKTEVVYAALAQPRHPLHCIACGQCSLVCPVHLHPFRVLNQRNYRTVKELAAVCIGCGCCDYICPSALPLRESIARQKRPAKTARKDQGSPA